jgi:hypothetical protein
VSHSDDLQLAAAIGDWVVSLDLVGLNVMRGEAVDNTVRLRGWKKALKGESQERIRHEIRPTDSRADESVTRLRKPEDAGGQAR